MRKANVRPDPPITHHVNVVQALETLDHKEMVALAEMFERWAFTEKCIDSERRTNLIQWASDYQRIAEFCGPNWKAANPTAEKNLMAVVAKFEMGSSSSGLR